MSTMASVLLLNAWMMLSAKSPAWSPKVGSSVVVVVAVVVVLVVVDAVVVLVVVDVVVVLVVVDVVVVLVVVVVVVPTSK